MFMAPIARGRPLAGCGAQRQALRAGPADEPAGSSQVSRLEPAGGWAALRGFSGVNLVEIYRSGRQLRRRDQNRVQSISALRAQHADRRAQHARQI